MTLATFAVALLALAVCAAALTDDGSDTSSAAVTTGTTGDCTWSLDGTTLTISGTGAMADYTYADSQWWGTSDVTTVIISNGVTHIGNFSFQTMDTDSNHIASVTIPDSVTSIGVSAFFNCAALTSLTIPDSVTSIGESAFSFCSALTSIAIPSGVTAIEVATFNECSALTSIAIPDSVTSIGESAFVDCAALTSIAIPDSVTSINRNTFADCTGLTSVTIPDSVTSIGDGAFSNSFGLTEVIFTSTAAPTIGADAFAIGAWGNGSYAAATLDVYSPGWADATTMPDSTHTNTVITFHTGTPAPAVTNVTIIYDLAGGSSALTSQTVTVGSTVTLPTAADGIARDAYALSGWTAVAGSADLLGATVVVSEDMTVYAVWTAAATPEPAGGLHFSLQTWAALIVVLCAILFGLASALAGRR